MMRTIAILILSLACSFCASGQGHFGTRIDLTGDAVSPAPTSSPNTGWAVLTLDGDLFFAAGYVFPSPYRSAAMEIRGPAGPGEIGPLIFSTDFVLAFGPPEPPTWGLPGRFFPNLSAAQITDLLAGRWYVSIVNPDFPEGELRGQITMVPEPSTWALLAMGGGLAIILGRRKRAVTIR